MNNLSIFAHYNGQLKKKIKIIHNLVCIEYDPDRTYMLITEIDEDNQLFTYSVRIPDGEKVFNTFTYYSEILN
jgi:hypothetical protein